MAKYFTKEGEDFKEVDAFSQTEVDEIVTKRLDRERSKFADYDDLKEKAGSVDALKSEFETKLGEANTKVEDLTKQLGSAKLETEKVKIMTEFKLGDDMAEFITGDSAEDMRKRAEKLAKGIKPSKVTLDKEGKPAASENKDSKAIAGKLFGRKSGD